MSFFGWGKNEPQKKNITRKATQPRNKKPKPKAKQPKKEEFSGEQIYESVDKKFFQDANETHFDPVADVLNSLSDEATALDLERMIATREAQLTEINSRLYAQVIDNYDKFVQGMVHIRELGVDLETTVNLCRNGRTMLKKADKEIITAPINIIANNRKSILYGVWNSIFSNFSNIFEKTNKIAM